MTATGEDLVGEYVQTYVEWRAAYGLGDACMDELLAALQVESERAPFARNELQLLAHVIMTQRHEVLGLAML